jgi:hypothetical protein
MKHHINLRSGVLLRPQIPSVAGVSILNFDPDAAWPK